MVEIAEEKNCVLSIGHVEQFNPALRMAFDLVGQPKFVQSCRASSYTYRSTDIGVVHDLMIHDIDLVNAAFGGKMMRSHACGFSVFGNHEDIAQARLQFSCGGIANLTASRCSFNAERNMQIFGTDGFAAVDLANHSVKSIRYPGWMKNKDFDFSSATAEQRDYIKENLFKSILPVEESEPVKTNAILDEQVEWVEAILTGAPVRNTGRKPQQRLFALLVKFSNKLKLMIGKLRHQMLGEPISRNLQFHLRTQWRRFAMPQVLQQEERRAA